MLPVVFTKTKKNHIMPDLTNFVTTTEAAQELGFHVNHIRRMVRRGDIETMRVGQMIFISLKSIKAYKDKTKDFDKHSPLKRENLNSK
jgi:excisionase family DNA binding protein